MTRGRALGFAVTCFSLVASAACGGSSGSNAGPPPADGGADTQEVATDTRPVCSPTAPDGDCPPDEKCVDGACVPISECARDGNEPNDSRLRATPLPIDTELEGNACEDDADWFRIEVPANQLVHVLATVPKKLTSNLDAYAYTEDGTLLGGLWRETEPHPSFALPYETTEEGFGFYGAATGATYFVKVVPRSPTHAGAYKIWAHATEWKDGPTCAKVGYSPDECTGGALGAQTLWMFPYMNPTDSFVGAGYMFDEFSNYRYLRRETMMLIRYAISEVSRQFPGTTALGLADMCQRNGITPGYEVGKPRHPGNSHDQGGNIDVAYYQTGKDNHVRVICDAKGGSATPDDYYCLDSAATTHIVDLPRTVYFVVALTRDPRFRAAGVDRVIGPIMQKEAERQRDAGIITSAELTAYTAHVVWGDGWPAHHHHLHLSMKFL